MDREMEKSIFSDDPAHTVGLFVYILCNYKPLHSSSLAWAHVIGYVKHFEPVLHKTRRNRGLYISCLYNIPSYSCSHAGEQRSVTIEPVNLHNSCFSLTSSSLRLVQTSASIPPPSLALLPNIPVPTSAASKASMTIYPYPSIVTALPEFHPYPARLLAHYCKICIGTSVENKPLLYSLLYSGYNNEISLFTYI